MWAKPPTIPALWTSAKRTFDAARSQEASWSPHRLRRVDVGEEALAKLKVFIGFNALAGESTWVANRIRFLVMLNPRHWSEYSGQLLTQIVRTDRHSDR